MIFVGTPTHDGRLDMGTHTALVAAALSGIQQMQTVQLNSLITQAFNALWAQALNARKRGVTHFLMLHADVAPAESQWLKIMLSEMESTGADVLSAVIPIKNSDGLTTTALDVTRPHQSWRDKRLSMTEVMQLPETFTANEAYDKLIPEWEGERRLLVNTGLLLVDFRKDWVEGFRFTIRDEIVKCNGEYQARSESEDWNMGRQLHALGLDVRATRKVRLTHVGRADFPNDVAWGVMKTDTAVAV